MSDSDAPRNDARINQPTNSDQERHGADPAQDRDDDAPKDGPIGNKPGAHRVNDADDPKAQ